MAYNYQSGNNMVANQMPQTVYVVEPVMAQGGTPQQWNNSVCGCLDDMGVCCMTCCCPCVQYGKNYEAIYGEGCCAQGCFWALLSMIGCSCCIHKGLRRDIRHRWNLDSGCGDMVTTCCCPLCAVCQEAREIKTRQGPF